jgi:HAD superfamily hydrolase (TIGR01509 family)
MSAPTGKTVEWIEEAIRENIVWIELFEKGKISPADFWAEIQAVIRSELSYEEFFAAYCDVFSLNRPVAAFLKSLSSKYKMVLMSNTDIMRFSFIKSRFPEILFFHAYALSFDFGFAKPDPSLYRAALETAGAKAENTVFIDDLRENIAGAENAGIRGILFGPETDLRAELRNFSVSV